MFSAFKKTLAVTALLMCGNALASDPKHSAGVILGQDTVIAYKHSLTKGDKVLASLGWGNGFAVGADFQRHVKLPQKELTAALTYYYGLGAQFKFEDDEKDNGDELTVRMPLGVDLTPVEIPGTVYLELAPGVGISDETKFKLSASLGFLYNFDI